MARQKRFTKKEWSWIMYDWANSIYATNICAAIYPSIFATIVSGGDIKWGYATSAATLIVALLAPFLGALADYKGMKKKLFTVFTLIGCLMTPIMAFTAHWKLCLVGYVFSRIGFSGSCLFYDSFLTDVTTDERMDKVSSWGYAMGYIGGSTIPFVISIAMLLIFDYSPFAQAFSVVITSVWWLVFSIPMLKNVHHEHYIEKPEKFNASAIIKGVGKTFRDICGCAGLLIFVLAYFFYIDGVDTIINISTAYGATLGLGTTGMILALLVTQIVAVPCSIWFAKIADKFNARKALIGAVTIYLIICILGFYMGFSMEPSQDAYETVFNKTYETLEIDADLKEDADALLADVMSAWKAEYPEEELGEVSEALVPVKEALFAAADANMDKVTAFRDAISFSTILFWVMATMVGTVQGGIQAVSRSYFGKLIPKERSNEFYGFFDIFGKFASFLGPVIYSTCAALTGRSSIGVLGLAALFLAGLLLLVCGKKAFEQLDKSKI